MDDASDAVEGASSRMDELRAEAEAMKTSGGASNPDRMGMIAGLVLFGVAVIIEIVALSQSSSATDARDQTDMVILALLGVVVALGAVGLFVRFALTRWFRFWLVRLIYEDRQQTDRIVAAIRDDD